MRSYVVVDVFTDVPLEGNPVAVFEDGAGLSTETMQRAARELNLSETVFLLPGESGADARARIFTPYVELPFAGHPVLGTAFVLGQRSGADSVTLLTGSGPVTIALQRRQGTIVFGEMHQPIPTWEPFERPDELLAALGVGGSELPIDVYDNGPRHTFVAVGDEIAVAKLRPDIGALAELGPLGVSCFAVTDGRVKTRMFGPGLGVAEDPATGSAAGPLAVHLARHGQAQWGQSIVIRQGVEVGRPSVLHARADGSPARVERVVVGGGAVLVARGEYRLDG
jgi:trans-2,3-dihydro-3-hydroxyanthranilate isomerase